MFDSAGNPTGAAQSGEWPDTDALYAALTGLGLVPPTRYGTGQEAICAVAQRISVRDVMEGNDAGTAALHRVCHPVAKGLPVTLSLENVSGTQGTIDVLQSFCESVAAALAWRGLTTQHIGLCMQSHLMPLEAYCLVADTILGRGPRYVFFDSLQMSAHANRTVERRADANWSFLWRRRGGVRTVMPVYGGVVRSACPLVADEVATAVLPGDGLLCPADSAWIPVTLPITRFADEAGRLRWRRLEEALERGLRIADQLVDQSEWFSAGQAKDARQNRRIAITLSGLGDLVTMRKDDPASLDCLNRLVQDVTRIRHELRVISARLAGECGELPALAEANHVSQWRAGPQRESWRRHWEAARRQSAMRHRNLLAISPYAVLPANSPGAPAFADLLPVIGLADAWCFSRPPDFRGWNAASYQHFHRRARATIQASHRASFVAARA